MSNTVFLFQAPTGIPGDVSRPDHVQVEPAKLVALATVFADRFGQAMRYVAGGIQQWTTGLTKTDFAGVLVRQAPHLSGDLESGESFGGGAPNGDQIQGLLVEGYVHVEVTAGVPVRGGTVYCRIVDAANRPIGAFEAAADGGNSVALDPKQASWAVDGIDADGNGELRVDCPLV